MKKILAGLALVTLMGAGCAGGSSSNAPAGTSEKTTVAWVYYEDLDCMKMIVSGPAAKAIGYPNGPTDSICASEATTQILIDEEGSETSGSANVILSNARESESTDDLWLVDVKLAE